MTKQSSLISASTRYQAPSQPAALHPNPALGGKHVAMVSFSLYPADPRPRRAAEALLKEGMTVDFICLADGTAPRRERWGELNILRLPIDHRRGGKFSYAYKYSAFILATAVILALRSLKRRYHLIYIHNMPDVLVFSSLVPKALGAKVILDQHDPMPELMASIFKLDERSFGVQLMRRLEKWSIARANAVVTVNIACKRIFAARSCRPEKIVVVMNAPDCEIFQFQAPRERPNGRFVIMYHGLIVERNGLDLAIEAMERVRSTVPNVELRIYGWKTAFLEQVMDQARNRGLQDCVQYLGPRRLEELVQEIDACDLGIIPNQRNAFTDINTPTRIFEYLALGKPVIAPRTPGIQDYFGPDALLFFESGNAEALSQQIEYAALYPDEALNTAKLAQQTYLTHVWTQERKNLVNLVCGLLNGERQS
jgi:glycosyltransferase involved in cell wall biosynthesis